MPRWLNNPQAIKLVLILIVFGFGFLSWVFKQLQAQAAKRSAERRREQMELERLRTGGVEPRGSGASREAEAASAREAMEAMAAQRRARMEELRRQQAERMGRASPGGVSSPRREDPMARVLGQILGIPGGKVPAPKPVPRQAEKAPGAGRGVGMKRPADRPPTGGRNLEKGRVAQPMAGAGRPAAARAATARATPPAAATSTRAAPPATPRVETPHEASLAMGGPRVAARVSGPAIATSRGGAGAVVWGKRLSGTGLRQLFVLREMLDPPVALREERSI